MLAGEETGLVWVATIGGTAVRRRITASARCLHPSSTLPPDSLTQGDNDLRLVFCVLGASIMGSYCQSNVSPLASQRSLIRDCRTFGGRGGHTLECVEVTHSKVCIVGVEVTHS